MKIEIEISPDKMKAFAKIVLEDGEISKDGYIKKEVLLNYLGSRGIVYGIKDLPDVIKIGERYLVAEGKPPVPGRDARIEILHNVDKELKPKILEDGRVDYRELDTVVIIKKGEIIARRIPPTSGLPGMNIKGEVIPSKPGREEALGIGINIEPSSRDENIFVAKVDGQLIEEDGKISVFPLFEVKGDVDFSVGNIKFPGNVVVRRNVKPGFKIEAEGNVEIYESAEECDIIAEGDIIIKKSFIGKGKSCLKAKGNVIVGFIDGGKIIAGEDVISRSAIMHSSVKAGSNVVVEGKGIITGGEIFARQSIVARIVGSKFGTHTFLKIERPIDTEEKVRELKNKLKENENMIKQLEVKIRSVGRDITFEKLKNMVIGKKLNLPTPQMLIINKIINTYDNLIKEISEIKNQLNSLNLILEKFKNSNIIIKNMIFPGVIIMFGDLSFKVRDVLNGVKFYFEGGEVKFSNL